mgnify:FL=1|jgi:hypothetical protein
MIFLIRLRAEQSLISHKLRFFIDYQMSDFIITVKTVSFGTVKFNRLCRCFT